MRYLVAYDITDDRNRDRLAKILLDFGQRLQESLFICNIEPEQKSQLLERAEQTINPIDDKLHIVPICNQCWQSVEAIGIAAKPEDPGYYVI